MDEIKQVTLNLDSSSWEILKALPSQAREAFVLFAIKNSTSSEFYKTMTAKSLEQVAEVSSTTTTKPQQQVAKQTVSWDSF